MCNSFLIAQAMYSRTTGALLAFYVLRAILYKLWRPRSALDLHLHYIMIPCIVLPPHDWLMGKLHGCTGVPFHVLLNTKLHCLLFVIRIVFNTQMIKIPFWEPCIYSIKTELHRVVVCASSEHHVHFSDMLRFSGVVMLWMELISGHFSAAVFECIRPPLMDINISPTAWNDTESYSASFLLK